MTDKELRKLKRADLLEILFRLQTEVETLRAENESLRHCRQEPVTVSLSDTQMQQLQSHLRETVRQALRGTSGDNEDE